MYPFSLKKTLFVTSYICVFAIKVPLLTDIFEIYNVSFLLFETWNQPHNLFLACY